MENIGTSNLISIIAGIVTILIGCLMEVKVIKVYNMGMFFYEIYISEQQKNGLSISDLGGLSMGYLHDNIKFD